MEIESLLIRDGDFENALTNKIKPWISYNLKKGCFDSYDGSQICYYFAINPNEKAAIVISHGFCEFVSKYHEVMYYFYSMGYSVFLIEHRGHGFSQRFVTELDKVYVKDYQEYVDDIKCFMDNVVSDKSITHKYILYAHSMGGAIATLFLEEYPQYFVTAVLSSPLMQINYGKTPQVIVKLVLFFSKIFDKDCEFIPGQKGFDNKYAFINSSCLSEERYAYVFNERQREPKYTTYGGTNSWLRASRKAVELIHRNAFKINIPVLLLQAGMDFKVDNYGHELFLQETDKTNMVKFEKSKHEIFNATEDIRTLYYKEIFNYISQYG